MRRSLTALLMAPVLFLAPRFVTAAEMPSDLDHRAPSAVSTGSGVSAEDVRDMDAVERAELARSEPARQGGDAIITIAVLLAIVALVYIYFQHEENMRG